MKTILQLLLRFLLLELEICQTDNSDQNQELILFDTQMLLKSLFQAMKSVEFDSLTKPQQIQVINGYRLYYDFLKRTKIFLDIQKDLNRRRRNFRKLLEENELIFR